MHDMSVLRAEDLEQSRYITQTFVMVFFKVNYEVRFHTTSRPPHWYSKTIKRRLCWSSNQSYGIEPFCYAKTFLCCNEFSKLLVT